MGNTSGRELRLAEQGRRPSDKEMLVLFKMQRALFCQLVASPEHLQLLQRYWTSSFRRAHQVPGFVLASNLWQEVGFSDANPAADLKPVGELGLQCLVFFVETYPAETAMMRRGRGGYPFVKTAVAIVRSLSLIMHLVDAMGNPGKFPVSNALFWQLVERDDSFFELFALAFLTFEELFCEEVAANLWMRDVKTCTMVVVDKLVARVETKLMNELKKAPLKLVDLQDLCSNGRHIVNKTNRKTTQASWSSTDSDLDSVSRWSQHFTLKRKNVRVADECWNAAMNKEVSQSKEHRLQPRMPDIQRPSGDSFHAGMISSNCWSLQVKNSATYSEQKVFTPTEDLFAGLVTKLATPFVNLQGGESDKTSVLLARSF